jgi:hypothetical protein
VSLTLAGALATVSACGGGSAPSVTDDAGGPLDLRGEVMVVVRDPDLTGTQSTETAVPLRLVRLSDPDGESIRLGAGTSIETSAPSTGVLRLDEPEEATLPLTDPLVLQVHGGDEQPSHCREVALVDPPATAREVECAEGRPPITVGRWTVTTGSRDEIVDEATGERSLPAEPDARQRVLDVHVEAEAIAVGVRLASGVEVVDLITPDGRRTVVEPPFFHRAHHVRFDSTGQVLVVGISSAEASELRRIPLDGGEPEVIFEGMLGRWLLTSDLGDGLLVFAGDLAKDQLRVLRGDPVQGTLRELATLDASLAQEVAVGEDGTIWIRAVSVSQGASTLHTVRGDEVRPFVLDQRNVDDIVLSEDGTTAVGIARPGPTEPGARPAIVATRGGKRVEIEQLPWEGVAPLDLSPDGATLHVQGRLDDDQPITEQHGIWRIDLDGDARPVRVSDQLVVATVGAHGFLRWQNPLELE